MADLPLTLNTLVASLEAKHSHPWTMWKGPLNNYIVQVAPHHNIEEWDATVGELVANGKEGVDYRYER